MPHVEQSQKKTSTQETKFIRHPFGQSGSISYETEDGDRIVVEPYFLYEISKDMFIIDGVFRRYELLETKFVKSDKYIKSQSVTKYYPSKKRMEYCITKSIVMLGAPAEFIREHNLPIWELKKKKHGKSNISKR